VCRWLLPVIPATQEAEIKRIMVQSQPRQIVQETLSRKNPSQKSAGGVAQAVGPEFKPQYHKKKKNSVENIKALGNNCILQQTLQPIARNCVRDHGQRKVIDIVDILSSNLY
jgi:hypothetical protein